MINLIKKINKIDKFIRNIWIHRLTIYISTIFHYRCVLIKRKKKKKERNHAISSKNSSSSLGRPLLSADYSSSFFPWLSRSFFRLLSASRFSEHRWPSFLSTAWTSDSFSRIVNSSRGSFRLHDSKQRNASLGIRILKIILLGSFSYHRQGGRNFFLKLEAGNIELRSSKLFQMGKFDASTSSLDLISIRRKMLSEFIISLIRESDRNVYWWTNLIITINPCICKLERRWQTSFLAIDFSPQSFQPLLKIRNEISFQLRIYI